MVIACPKYVVCNIFLRGGGMNIKMKKTIRVGKDCDCESHQLYIFCKKTVVIINKHINMLFKLLLL